MIILQQLKPNLERILGAIFSSETSKSLNVFLCLRSISLIINKDHLSPTISNVEEIGQPEQNSLFIVTEYHNGLGDHL